MMPYKIIVLSQVKAEILRTHHAELHKHVRLMLLRGIWSSAECEPEASSFSEECYMCLGCEVA